MPKSLSELHEAQYRRAAEWEAHHACWLAWPWDESLWKEDLAGARAEWVNLCQAIADYDPSSGAGRGEKLHILVRNERDEKQARLALGKLAGACRFFFVPTGDIWLRDTAPVFVTNASGQQAAICFSFNGWGNKFLLPHDPEVAQRVATAAAVPAVPAPLVAEGGAVECDGAGTCLTTRQCLLNTNRNPGLSENDLTALLKQALGVQHVVWLERGLQNDHTDGHIDNLARFIGPGKIAYARATDDADPNRDILNAIHGELQAAQDAAGRPFELVALPAAGDVRDAAGSPMAASYLNFYIGNRAVVVPAFGKPTDQLACETLKPHFPDRRVVSLPARRILTGGGTFHCITQQQ